MTFAVASERTAMPRWSRLKVIATRVRTCGAGARARLALCTIRGRAALSAPRKIASRLTRPSRAALPHFPRNLFYHRIRVTLMLDNFRCVARHIAIGYGRTGLFQKRIAKHLKQTRFPVLRPALQKQLLLTQPCLIVH